MPESVALHYLFYAYSAVFLVIFAFSGRAHHEISKLERDVKELNVDKQHGASM